MVKCWSEHMQLEFPETEPATPYQLCFSASVDQAVRSLESKLFDFVNSEDYQSLGCLLPEKLVQEMEQYFTTGNCDGSATQKACPNPTSLEPNTGQWFVHYAASQFDE